MKKILTLFSIIVLCFFNAQTTNFPYYQQWGTYVGGAGTLLDDHYYAGTSFFSDSADKFYVNGQTSFLPGYSAPYYAQFSINGGSLPTMQGQDQLQTSFSPSGSILTGDYTGNNAAVNNGTYSNRLLGIDGADNKYFVKHQTGIVQNLATPGVWLTADSTTNNLTSTVTLSKYDALNNLLWTTYLPRISSEAFALRFDENENVYVRSNTTADIPNIGTPGAYQENFIPYNYSTGTASSNGYIVKLNSTGQKIWGSFFVADILDFEYYNGNIYTSNSYDVSIPVPVTTSGTFQPNAESRQLLMKFDATTSQQVWGTFYGTPLSTNFVGIGAYDIAVNSNGFFILGQTEDASYPTYYATAGAFKSQLSGGSDLFLSKFDLTGNRVWSTYFGSTGYDTILSGGTLAIFNDRIVITGDQYGNSSNIATPGAFLTTPSNSSPNYSNMFFAEFDGTTGNRTWASYFGGAGYNLFGEYIHPEFLTDGSLILWGSTGAQTGITTEDGAFPTMLNPSVPQPFGFVTRFDFRDKLATQEISVKETDMQFYPNPVEDVLTIKTKENLKTYEIISAVGQQVKRGTFSANNYTINMQELTKGVYYVKVFTEKISVVEKVVKK